MIAEYLDRKLVLQQLRAQRDFLVKLRKLAGKKDKETLAALRKNKITVAQLDRAIAALKTALAAAKKDRHHTAGAPFIPRDPVTCGMQAGLTQLANEHGKTEARPVKKSAAPARRAVSGAKRAKAADTSPLLQLKHPPGAPATAAQLRRAAFVEGDDFHYGVDGFFAKFGALFTKKRPFNKTAARTVSSAKPLRLFVFGDWGTGLPLADAVRRRIDEQLAAADGTRAQHVVHLGDVYYVGEPEEYIDRVFPFWPVPPNRWKQIGSWSLNGNHDMYKGGHGYFDTLLANEPFRTWHADAAGKPSSFFLIEDAHWQVFGLDTSWNTPPLSAVPFGRPTKEDYGGMNGIITNEQAAWMAAQRNRAKGCILLTHHQPAASRTTEKQHSDETVALLRKVKVYDSIDAWLWGHEHRAVVFRPRAARAEKSPLAGAPDFCACIGHGGVPVTDKNFEAENTIADVLWQEDGRGVTRPVYEKETVMPFGFARIETRAGSFDFRVFDHDGHQRYSATVNRTT